MSQPTTHAAIYATLRDAIIDAGYTQDHHLLGNVQAPSPLRAGSFRIEPTGYEDTGAYAVQRDGVMRIRESITVHVTDPMDTQQEASWLAARLRANGVISAVLTSALQVVDLDGVTSALESEGNYIRHAIDFGVTYDLAVT